MPCMDTYVDFSKDLVVPVPSLASSAQIAASNAVPTSMFSHIPVPTRNKRVSRSPGEWACTLCSWQTRRNPPEEQQSAGPSSERSPRWPRRSQPTRPCKTRNKSSTAIGQCSSFGEPRCHMKQDDAAGSGQQLYLTAVRGGKRQPTLRRSALTCSSGHNEARAEDEKTCHDIDTYRMSPCRVATLIVWRRLVVYGAPARRGCVPRCRYPHPSPESPSHPVRH